MSLFIVPARPIEPFRGSLRHIDTMNITITGASGAIGRRLLKALAGHSIHVLSRHAGTNLPPGVRLSVWSATSGPPPAAALTEADAVVHLAGEPVAQRWNAEVKERIRATRVAGTRNLVSAFTAMERRPSVLVSASAIGIYGDRGDEVLDEHAAPGSGFLPEVCTAWEREAAAAEALGIRVVCLRIGIVLMTHGGALARMLPPFRAGLGGPLGSGRQWMSWIHIDDLVSLIRFAVEGQLRGAVNASAPEPVRNREFTRVLGSALGRPAFLPVPEFGLKLLFGEMSEVLLGSQRVLPAAAEGAGFQFAHPRLDDALGHLLSRR
jgi:uncharacterized protein (TIGR01777 family)